MLILQRGFGESIIIRGDITIKILGVEKTGEKALVKLGIDAPSDVSVHREEVQYAIDRGEGPKRRK